MKVSPFSKFNSGRDRMRRIGKLLGMIVMMLAVGCGNKTEVPERAITLQTPGETIRVEENEPLTSDADTETEENWEDHLMPVPDELKSMDGSQEWQEGMKEYCKKAAPFWKEIVDQAPLKWGEEISGLGAYEAMASWTMWSYLDQQGMTSSLYQISAFDKIEIGGGLIQDGTYFQPYLMNEHEMKEGQGAGDGYYTKIHGIFANGGDGELYYNLKDEEGNVVWEYTQGPGCGQVFSDVELKAGKYTMYIEIKSGNPFPSGRVYEFYRFTEEENKKAMEEYAQFHGEE